MLDSHGLPAPPEYFLERLRDLQTRLRDHVRACRDAASPEAMAAVGERRDGDTLYAIDLRSEEVLLEFCERWGAEVPLALIAEGIPGNGWRVFPRGARPAEARFCLIVDPIDGTRGLMYDKRSAWVLSGVAPNHGAATAIPDIAVAVQTEIPTTRQHLADVLWAVRGQGAHAERHNLVSGETRAYTPRPSHAPTLAHGFAGITKFFPGARDLVARLEEALFERVVGTPADGNPLVFDDQYIATAGQLYELTVGHDRFNADLRPLALAAKYPAAGIHHLCCHPYDCCTELIAREAGVIITGPDGRPLDARLDIREDVAWIGYANPRIRALVEPVLLDLLQQGRWGG
ncbi:MAG: inositol monophosphatase [Armatimonadetes bacterium]|nr:inositol monophosphatase [Armatimonadota bacterium]